MQVPVHYHLTIAFSLTLQIYPEWMNFTTAFILLVTIIILSIILDKNQKLIASLIWKVVCLL